MEDEKIKNWEKVKKKLAEDYPQLTPADLIYEVGKEEELLHRLEEKLKEPEEEIRKWLSFIG